MTQHNAAEETYDREAEFSQEAGHLEDVIAGVDRDIIRQSKNLLIPTIGPDARSADVALAAKKASLSQVEAARSSPFFGRVDYSASEEGETVRTIYIGRHHMNLRDIPDGFIVNHNAPVAALYYNPTSGGYVVKAGDKEIEKAAKVYKKRTLTIQESFLQDFEDVLSLPVPRLLTDMLSAPSSEYMLDAVETLQPEQYAALSRTDSSALIVQGAAGSGKSLIGLQRIEFILSPHSEIGVLGRPAPDRIIMFGPSRAFLDYVSGFLPGMDVPHIRQMTVSQWLLGQFSALVQLKGGEERIFDDLMSNRRGLTNDEIEAHLYKGSMKMKRLLDNYVTALRRDAQQALRRQSAGIISRLSLSISVAELKSMVDGAFSLQSELNAARAILVDRLAELRARTAPRPPRMRNASQSELVSAHRTEVSRALDYIWPFYDFRREYVRLTSGPEVLQAYDRRGDLDRHRANEICQTVPRNATGRSLGMTDLAAALYLDYSLNGLTSEGFQHVVVDEAQDVSPFEMELLRMHSLNQSFTILGDLKQGLLPHRSITNWNQFSSLFARGSVSRADMRLTYRNTKQITQYANRILQGLPMRTTKPPMPYGRTGVRPELARSRSAAEMGERIVTAVERLRELDEVRTVAVLTKWESTAREIVRMLISEGVEDVSALVQGGSIETDIVVSPIILTKGLEFDAVIVANAGKNNYNDTEFDRMLLYLACTRARHHLEIHWYGTGSKIMPSIERLAR